ncbi:hypothetical protein RhiirA5_418250 [Rhizophagus irregularis]|uniref:HTH myb-type domain-containing protein n=3 Tax=Rhizophagus irregularis TaxID=588596 RepID=U9UF80_RHIID|nr:hypothetical protein GLOIN_2v1769545 [Rhizophagus irregularis DAOM 181602=DAOM 197198]EXX72567.1 hypothetical protein RirG_068140 [Rhizophagus irregularis DAOM 197198w]PKC07409.1 hypothetical protein RhiirA5_418250 [Rhizophagus irregularis]PKC73905.1 hypothetical protein RhiirA1_450599 [Rhizophagus irregularis]PKY22446.1 hypothetical protein RhiirB3_503255 [Rhizophagus irregularis]POG75935.1 hypothetical protein GLOIN_2v1769545 [Rhizophagus irregularis DAOM 181602=DAOM 197198]|eukprot:XP_025182801.1 hypothetical protein GLOIN_2v1769545 [Rhizophagus irregularis DAOM 181602=DAOM 197198]
MNYQSEREKRYNKIDSDSEKIIVDYMQKWINNGKVERDPFVQISKMIPHDPKKICHHWTNKLNPKLCLAKDVPITLHEKEYIFEWVENYLNSNNKPISWKLLQLKMKEKFGILRSRNDLKNVWNINKRKMIKRDNHVNIVSIPLFENYLAMNDYISYFLQPPSYQETTELVASDMILETFNYLNYFECISDSVIPL